jgi:hypothetical protein
VIRAGAEQALETVVRVDHVHRAGNLVEVVRLLRTLQDLLHQLRRDAGRLALTVPDTPIRRALAARRTTL